jgi:acetolactate synthase-1/2/3 large subunit
MDGANLLLAALENEGAKQIFAVPGQGDLDIVEVLLGAMAMVMITGQKGLLGREQAAPRRSTLASRLCDLAPNAPVPFPKAHP